MSAQVSSITDLPAPAADARLISEQLLGRIIDAIHNGGGQISFRRYMEMALYEPGLGYYSAGSTKLGADGDFITAPETSPLFGRCLAMQCAEILSTLQAPVIMELGAGSGRLACDVLRMLDRLQQLPDEYLILEVSADLRERQQALVNQLPEQLAARVKWLDGLPTQAFNGIILANEVMDAMPVVWFQVEDDYIGEVCVHEQQGELALGLTDSLSHDQQAHVRSLFAVAPDSGYSSEYNPALAGWIAGLSDCLAQGTMLLIDYGNCRDEYYHPQRSKGTMMCYYRHRGHDDPLWLPGLQDITADVDFTAVAEAASAAGLSVAGYATQGHFLMGAGLDQVLQQAQQEEAAQFPLYIEQVKKLTMPGDMGERFKVMALARGVEQPLRGFQFFDHRHRL